MFLRARHTSCPTDRFTVERNTLLPALVSFIIVTCPKQHKRKHVKVGVKEKPKEPQELDKAEVADKEWQALYTRQESHG